MTRINLLPWREVARRQRRRDLGLAAAGAMGLTLLVAVVVHLQIEAWISDQGLRNQFLENQIAVLNRKLQEIKTLEQTKAKLLSRMEIIQQLQQSRPQVVRLFDELVSAMPEGVFLTRLEQTGQSLIVEGRAESNARVSALMRNIEESEWIGNPRLLLIENKDKTGTGMSHFRLGFDQTQPSPATAAAPIPAAGAPTGASPRP